FARRVPKNLHAISPARCLTSMRKQAPHLCNREAILRSRSLLHRLVQLINGAQRFPHGRLELRELGPNAMLRVAVAIALAFPTIERCRKLFDGWSTFRGVGAFLLLILGCRCFPRLLGRIHAFRSMFTRQQPCGRPWNGDDFLWRN